MLRGVLLSLARELLRVGSAYFFLNGVQQVLKIMLVDEQIERAARVQEALAADRCEVICVLNSALELYERIRQCAPDVIIIDTESPSRDVIEHISLISRDQPRPIVMLAVDREGETIHCAIRAGVTANVVDGLAAERIQPILNVTKITEPAQRGSSV